MSDEIGLKKIEKVLRNIVISAFDENATRRRKVTPCIRKRRVSIAERDNNPF
jgi:hypothetical protein